MKRIINKNSFIKNIFAVTTILSMTIIVCSCGRKEVQLEQNDTINVGTVTDAGSNETNSLKEQYEIPDFWKETVACDGATINIGADVFVMDESKMNVYSTKKKIYTEEEKRDYLFSFSTDGKIYSGKQEDLPKFTYDTEISRLEQMIEDLENLDANAQPGNMDEYLAGVVEEYEYQKSEQEKAPNDYIETDDLSGDSFVVKHDGVSFMICIYENQTVEIKKVEEWTDFNVEMMFLDGDEVDLAEHEDAVKQAKFYVSNYLTEDEYEACEIYTTNEYKENTSEYEKSGYRVKFFRKLDGGYFGGMDSVGFMETYDYHQNIMDMLDSNQITFEEGQDILSKMFGNATGFDEIEVVIDNDGELVSARKKNTVETPVVEADGVKLLDFASVETAIFQGLQEQPLKYNGTVLKTYNHLSLAYMCMRNPEEKGEYMLVPAWLMEPTSSYGDDAHIGAFAINAIDGSVINVGEQFYGIEE